MPEFLERQDKPALAYEFILPDSADTTTVVFLPGFRSDMTGTKASFLAGLCEEKDLGYLRFDYSGHGASEGVFEDFCLSSWLDDTLDLLDEVTSGKCILVGSSMGGWIALRAALKRPERIGGVIGIAAAPDFTRDIQAKLSEEHKVQLAEQGYAEEITPYSDVPHRFTKNLLDDGENHILLDGPIPLELPVTLIQGMEDEDVNWQKAIKLGHLIAPAKARIYLLEDADHRLSRPSDLELLSHEILRMTERGDPYESGAEGDVNCFIRLSNWK